MVRSLLLLFCSAMLTGCALVDVQGHVASGEVLPQDATYCIKRSADDERQVGDRLRDDLARRGMEAVGPQEVRESTECDFRLAYGSRWVWDMSWYLHSFEVLIYESGTERFVASAQSRRSSIARESPEFVVREALDQIFAR